MPSSSKILRQPRRAAHSRLIPALAQLNSEEVGCGVRGAEFGVQDPEWGVGGLGLKVEESLSPDAELETRNAEPPDAGAMVADLIHQAEEEVARLREEAEAEAQGIREEAYRLGKAEGYAAGKNEAMGLVAAVQRIVDDALAAKEGLLAHATPQLLKLSVQIAEKIIRREVETDPQVIRGIVKDALRHATGTQLQVWVHPDDLAVLREAEPDLSAALENMRQLELLEDRRRVTRGGCIVETENGIIDARVETQLEEIATRLAGEDGNAPFKVT